MQSSMIHDKSRQPIFTHAQNSQNQLHAGPSDIRDEIDFGLGSELKLSQFQKQSQEPNQQEMLQGMQGKIQEKDVTESPNAFANADYHSEAEDLTSSQKPHHHKGRESHSNNYSIENNENQDQINIMIGKKPFPEPVKAIKPPLGRSPEKRSQNTS